MLSEVRASVKDGSRKGFGRFPRARSAQAVGVVRATSSGGSRNGLVRFAQVASQVCHDRDRVSHRRVLTLSRWMHDICHEHGTKQDVHVHTPCVYGHDMWRWCCLDLNHQGNLGCPPFTSASGAPQYSVTRQRADMQSGNSSSLKGLKLSCSPATLRLVDPIPCSQRGAASSWRGFTYISHIEHRSILARTMTMPNLVHGMSK